MARCGLRPPHVTATFVWAGHHPARILCRALAILAGPRANFFLRILFSRISDTRPCRPAWHPSRPELSPRSRTRFWSASFLVRAIGILVVGERSHAPGRL